MSDLTKNPEFRNKLEKKSPMGIFCPAYDTITFYI